MSDLLKKSCEACEGGVSPLVGDQAQAYLTELSDGWEIVDDHHIEKLYAFPNIVDALAFTNVIQF